MKNTQTTKEARAARLRWARDHAGYDSPTDAARALGIKAESTYLGHENGSRAYHRNAEMYARRFKVRLDWLWMGHGDPTDANTADAELIEALNSLPSDEAATHRRIILERARTLRS